MRNGICFELPTLVRPTAESGSSSWPTVRTTDMVSGRGAIPDGRTFYRPSKEYAAGRKVGQANLSDVTEMWASASAHDGRRPGSDATSTQGGNLKRDAEEWKTPTTDSAYQRTGRYAQGGLPLSKQAADNNWHTPDTMPDAPNSGSNTRSKPAGIGNQAREWMTPKAHEPGFNATTTGRPLDKATHLNTQASHWPTATADRATYASGENVNLNEASEIWKLEYPHDVEAMSSHQVQEQSQSGEQSSPTDQTSRRRLNYRFVEWLMGLPEEWMDFHALLDSESSGTG